MVTRRKFLTSAAALTASSFVDSATLQSMAAPSGGKRPNILIFMPDQTQGQTTIPGHPYPNPNIDRVASQRGIFSNPFCPPPHFSPPPGNLPTCPYPSRHRDFNHHD